MDESAMNRSLETISGVYPVRAYTFTQDHEWTVFTYIHYQCLLALFIEDFMFPANFHNGIFLNKIHGRSKDKLENKLHMIMQANTCSIWPVCRLI